MEKDSFLEEAQFVMLFKNSQHKSQRTKYLQMLGICATFMIIYGSLRLNGDPYFQNFL